MKELSDRESFQKVIDDLLLERQKIQNKAEALDGAINLLQRKRDSLRDKVTEDTE